MIYKSTAWKRINELVLAEIEIEGDILSSMIYFELNGFSSPVDLKEFLNHAFKAFKISIFSNQETKQDTLFREIHDQITSAKADLLLKWKEARFHMLLPPGSGSFSSVSIDGNNLAFSVSKIENSLYADFTVPLKGSRVVSIKYK